MRSLTFKTKILFIAILPLIFVALALIILSFYQVHNVGNKNAKAFANLMLELKRSELKNYTEVSLTTVKDVYKDNLSSPQNFKEATDNIVSNLDYVGDDFFFVYDYNNVIDDLEKSVGIIENTLNDNVINTFRITSITILLFSLSIGLVATRFTLSEGKLADEKLNQLAQKVVVAQEEERGRVANDLRYQVNKNLTLITKHLQKTSSVISDIQAREQFRAIAKALNITIANVQKISGDLRPAKLDELGLHLSIEILAKEVSEKRKINISYKSSKEIAPFRSEVETSIYRIIQETLQTVMNQKDVKSISIRANQNVNQLRLTIRSQGGGFNIKEIDNSSSRLREEMTNIRVRAESIGGSASIFSSIDTGTYIKIDIPV